MEKIKLILNFILGFIILTGFYFVSSVIIKFLHVPLSPVILGLILFAFALVEGIIKEEWIKMTSEFLIKNMAMFIVPFMGGLVVYKHMIMKNWLVILVVIFVTTTLMIIITGLFVEYGLKFLRLHKMRKNHD